jgi:hypothetical protein
MSHQEKQRIFDEYAKSKGHLNWQKMQDAYVIEIKEEILQDADAIMNSYMIHVFNACDLVQEEQQKRIAGNALEIQFFGETDEVKKVVDIQSIINPENKIS